MSIRPEAHDKRIYCTQSDSDSVSSQGEKLEDLNKNPGRGAIQPNCTYTRVCKYRKVT